MIRSVGDFLLDLKNAEATRLAEVVITHRPSIGEMYEGLSKDLLSRVVPPELQLQLVRGFVEDGEGGLSGQIDCMLVAGVGRPVPYTDAFIWHVKDVIAVFEIKKTLYGKDLVDAIDHLNGVRNLESRYFASLRESTDEVQREAMESGYRAFAETTGVLATHDTLASLPFELQLIFHTLTVEPFKFVGVIFGFHGFKLESRFRRALTDELQGRVGVHGTGPASLPQLIVSGNYSLCKANGQPFVAPLINGRWPILFSSADNPLTLLLEYLWTRLGRLYGLAGLWGEDLETQTARALLLAMPREADGRRGWDMEFIEASEAELRQVPSSEPWAPCEVTAQQAAVLQMLCAGSEVDLKDPAFLQYLGEEGLTVDDFVAALVATGLVAVAGRRLELITEVCQTVIWGSRIYAADNNTGRLSRWLERQMSEARKDG